jgi:hypothetical protein
MKIIASVDNPSPYHAADRITDNGPKNTRPNVAIASASVEVLHCVDVGIR